ncbi:MAG: hypothetical protein ACRCZF_10650, partial [Gemmataceae bacterium]
MTKPLLFDRSALGRLEVSGPDAPKFLTNLSTNDLREFPLGGGGELYFLDHRAKVLFWAIAAHTLRSEGRHAIHLVTSAGRGAALLAHLDRYLISEDVELLPVDTTTNLWHLTGPGAAELLGSILGEDLPALAEFHHLPRELPGLGRIKIRRYDPCGQPGYDLLVDIAYSDALKEAIVSRGASLATAEQYEEHRIAAGTPE